MRLCQENLTVFFLIASVLCAALATSAMAAGPAGFNDAAATYGQPQGFSLNEMSDIATLKKNAYDDQLVTIKGRFTKQLTKDKYEFTDTKGQTIVVELDDDRNWSHIRKDALVEIVAEVDKDFMSIELNCINARPLEK